MQRSYNFDSHCLITAETFLAFETHEKKDAIELAQRIQDCVDQFIAELVQND